MSGGLPDDSPGLEQSAPRIKRSLSAGATPTTRTSSTAPTAATSPTSFGPSGVVGVGQRSPEGQAQQPHPADPEQAR
eukprot:11104148-Alexandrium_andersonii.AAC.1